MSEDAPQRRPFTGSCHCGALRYIIYLRLPHEPPRDRKHGQQAFYRCNCTVCHKAGILHARVASSPDDFLLLSTGSSGAVAEDNGQGEGDVSDPLAALGDYTCNEGALHFLYCRTCAVRCFTFMGQGEVVEVEDEHVIALERAHRQQQHTGKEKESDSGKLMAWRPRKEGWKEGRVNGCYLSVNAITIDQGQDGFDLREWKEKGWILYLDVKRTGQPDQGHPSYERPHPGGTY